VTSDEQRQAEMVERSGMRSVPQIFLDNESVGGYDDLARLNATGELDRRLGRGEEAPLRDVYDVAVVGAGVFFVVALIFWGAARAMGGDARYSQMLAIWSHAALPSAIGSLLAIPLFLRMADGSLSQSAAERVLASNVGAFLDDSAPAALRTLGASLDVFSFAVLFLLVLGFRRIPGLSKGAATATPIVLWAVYVAAKVAWKAVMG